MQAVEALKAGDVIAYPTEAVYGLGCDPWNEQAVNTILSIKQRPWQKGLIIIASSIEQLSPFIAPLTPEMLAEISPTWPGPNTWLVPKSERLPSIICGEHNTIAVRVTAHQQTAALCEAYGGAIVSTSANRAGEEPAKTQQQVRVALPELSVVMSGECSGSDKPTSIRNVVTGEIIR
jgi:L-threonylcarbamoyladenylate synthase